MSMDLLGTTPKNYSHNQDVYDWSYNGICNLNAYQSNRYRSGAINVANEHGAATGCRMRVSSSRLPMISWRPEHETIPVQQGDIESFEHSEKMPLAAVSNLFSIHLFSEFLAPPAAYLVVLIQITLLKREVVLASNVGITFKGISFLLCFLKTKQTNWQPDANFKKTTDLVQVSLATGDY
jgi:hypothetical protein